MDGWAVSADAVSKSAFDRSVECSSVFDVPVFDECDTCPVFDDLCVSVFDDRGWMTVGG